MHLCANLYENFEVGSGIEKGTQLRDVIDLAIYVKKYISNSDWKRLYGHARQLGIEYKVYTSLLYANEFLLSKIDSRYIDLFCENKPLDKVQWETSFISRSLNRDIRIKDYIRWWKRNEYLITDNGVLLECDHEHNFDFAKSFVYRITDDRNVFSGKYGLSYDHDNLYYYILMSNSEKVNNAKYKLSLLFTDNDMTSELRTRTLVFSCQDEMVTEVIPERAIQCIKHQNDTECSYKLIIPLEWVNVDLKASSGRISFNIMFHPVQPDSELEDYGFLYSTRDSSHIVLRDIM